MCCNYYVLKGGSIAMYQCIEVEISDELADEIEKRAAAMQMSPSSYIKLVLLACLDRTGPLGPA